MRHRLNSADLPELQRVLDLIQQDFERKTTSGDSRASASPDALTKAGAAQARYGSAGVLLTQLEQLARQGAINPSVIAAFGDSPSAATPTSNVLVPPTITPKLTRHGELELDANGTDLKLDTRGYATSEYRLIREVP